MANGDALPDDQLQSMVWTPNEQQSAPRARDASAQVNVLGDPFWTLALQTTLLTPAQFAAWRAFVARRQGRRYTFLASPLTALAPAAGGVVSDSGIVFAGYDRAAQTIDLENAGVYQATAGDVISYVTSGSGYYCAEVIEDAEAIGGDITLTLGFPPLPPHASTPNVRRLFPIAEFAMTGVSKVEEVGALSWSLTAEQVIRG